MVQTITIPDYERVIVQAVEQSAQVIVPEPSQTNNFFTGSWVSRERVFQITVDGAQTILLNPAIVVDFGVDIFINGLKQPRSEFTVTSTLLTLPSTLNLMAGDTVTLIYQS